jgi:hypothetical protein
VLSFLSPLFLLGALAAAVPIVLHLLKREPEARIKFSAVQLLRRAPVEHARRRHLNELLLLLLRVAALVLLALAFARPFFASGLASASASLTVVALDTSLSLRAPGQFDKARAAAKAAVTDADTDLVALVTFDDAANVAARPSGDRGLAQAAIDRASPGFGGTRYRTAVAAADTLLAGRPGTLVVVTDMQASGWRQGDDVQLPAGVRLEVVDIGAPPPNFAVVAASASGDRIVASVRNSADEPRDARLRLTVDGRPAGEAVVGVDARQTADAALPRVDGRDAVVTVEDPAGADGDNSWHFVLDAAARPAVLVISATGDLDRDAFYLRRAIEAAGAGGARYAAEAVSAARLSSFDRAALERYAAVVLVSTRGLESRGRELLAGYARGGGGLLIAAGPATDPEVVSQTMGGIMSLTAVEKSSASDRSLAPDDVRHPVFEAFGARTSALSLVTFRQIALLSAGGCHSLARYSTGEPALVDCAVGEGQVIAMASDLNNAWNDFPLHATFVPFVQELLRYLSSTRPRHSGYLVADVPDGIPPVPGFATTDAGHGAVNADPAESVPDRLPRPAFDTNVVRIEDSARGGEGLAARQQEERQRVWQYVLALMIVMLAVETFVGARAS